MAVVLAAVLLVLVPTAHRSVATAGADRSVPHSVVVGDLELVAPVAAPTNGGVHPGAALIAAVAPGAPGIVVSLVLAIPAGHADRQVIENGVGPDLARAPPLMG
jgi:hypothetical protein